MNLISVQLKDVFCFKDISVSFEDVTMAMFLGKNGSGKSSLMDGVNWVLFDFTTRKNYDKTKVIRDLPEKCKQASGSVTLEEGGKRYKIVRQKGSINRLSFFIDGEKQTYKNPTITQQAIEKIIGFDFKTFTNVAYFSQNDSGKFLSGDSASRIESISNLLQLERFDEASVKAKQDALSVNSEMENKAGNLEAYKEMINNFDIANKRKEYKTKKSQFTIVQKDISLLSGQYEKLKLKNDLLFRKNQLKNDYNSERQSVLSRIEEYKQSIKILENDKKEESKLKSELSEIKAGIETYQNVEGEVVMLRKEEEGGKRNLEKFKVEYGVLKADKMRLEKMNDTLKSKGTVKCNVCYSIVSQSNSSHFTKEIVHINKRIDHLKESMSDTENTLKGIYESISLYDEQMSELNELEHKYQLTEIKLEGIKNTNKQIEITKENLEKYKKESKQSLDRRKSEYQDIKKELSKYQGVEGDLDVVRLKYQKKIEDKKELEVDIRYLKEDIDNYYENTRKVKELETQLIELETQYKRALIWKDAFPKIKLSIISEAIPFIEYEANYYLSELLSGCRLSFELDIDKANNKLSIVIEKPEYGVKRIFDGWSGGEKNKMSIAIFMALNKLASLKNKKSINFLLLDEKFAMLDDESRYDVLELMKKEFGKDRMLLAISHIPELQTEFDTIFYFNKVNHISDITKERQAV